MVVGLEDYFCYLRISIRLLLLLCRFSTFFYKYRIITFLPFFSDEMVCMVLVLCLVKSVCRWSADYASFSKGCVLCSIIAVNDLNIGYVICAKFIFGWHVCLENTRKCIFILWWNTCILFAVSPFSIGCCYFDSVFWFVEYDEFSNDLVEPVKLISSWVLNSFQPHRSYKSIKLKSCVYVDLNIFKGNVYIICEHSIKISFGASKMGRYM